MARRVWLWHVPSASLGDEVSQAILDTFQAFPADMGTSILTDREAGRPLEWDIRNGLIVMALRRPSAMSWWRFSPLRVMALAA